MKKDVWLTIRSRQQFEGCDEERVNLETAATLYERGGKYYIAYEESELTGSSCQVYTQSAGNTHQ